MTVKAKFKTLEQSTPSIAESKRRLSRWVLDEAGDNMLHRIREINRRTTPTRKPMFNHD